MTYKQLLLILIFTITACQHQTGIDDQPSIEQMDDYEVRLESHPAIRIARIDYSEKSKEYLGWIEGENGLDCERRSNSISILFNSLMIEADEVTGCAWLEDY